MLQLLISDIYFYFSLIFVHILFEKCFLLLFLPNLYENTHMKNINALIIIISISCFYTFISDLEKNLQFAGENRLELEKVLKY